MSKENKNKGLGYITNLLKNMANRNERIERRLAAIEQRQTSLGFRAIDYTDFIKEPLDNFIKLYKYNDTYYSINAASELHKAVVHNEGYEKKIGAFRTLLKADSGRNIERWRLKIQIIYAKKLESIDKYITCEGYFLTLANLSAIKGNPNMNRMSMMIDGEVFPIHRNEVVYRHFIDSEYAAEETFFIDGFFGNCAVDNLLPIESSKK